MYPEEAIPRKTKEEIEDQIYLGNLELDLYLRSTRNLEKAPVIVIAIDQEYTRLEKWIDVRPRYMAGAVIINEPPVGKLNSATIPVTVELWVWLNKTALISLSEMLAYYDNSIEYNESKGHILLKKLATKAKDKVEKRNKENE